MGQVIKTYLGLFLVLMILLSGTSVVFAMFDVSNAQSFLADCVMKIENSNWNVQAVGECFEHAKDSGYELEIQLTEGATTTVVHKMTEMPEDLSSFAHRKLQIQYPVRFLFALASLQAYMEGYVI